jgi:redox-sensitive bicupin YhaK (pirin superfamily)
METIVHKADSRGTAFFGWLHSRHTFSFGHYFDPNRVQFGALRVLNDDIVEPGMGFGTHPHDNMEIISIPLQGALAHKDSTGNEEVINTGEVQIMSAGTGLTHSEYNHSSTEKVNFLQIWVLPKERNIKPRYDQKVYREEERINKWQTVVAPDQEGALWINQDAWFNLTRLEAGKSLNYDFHGDNHGAYLFIIDGEIEIEGNKYGKRDGIGLSDTKKLSIAANSDANILLMEVPMN